MKTLIVCLAILISIVGLSSNTCIAQENQWSQSESSANFPRIPSNLPLKRHDTSNPSVSGPAQKSVHPPVSHGWIPMPMPSCKTTSGEPSGYVGYVYKSNGGGIQFQFNGPPAAGQLAYTRNDFDLDGIWVELALPMAIQENMGVMISCSHMFGLKSSSTQSYDFINLQSAARRWNPDIQWWEANAAGSYQFIPSVSGIFGFKWSSFAVTFNNPSNQVGFVDPNPNSVSLNTNAYIPYSGLMIENQPDCRSVMRFAAYGCPLLPADLLYSESLSFSNQQTTSIYAKANMNVGYFAEAVGDYSMRRDSWIMGGFARFSVLHVERSVGVGLGGVNTPTDITFERKNWIFGGRLGYSF